MSDIVEHHERLRELDAEVAEKVMGYKKIRKDFWSFKTWKDGEFMCESSGILPCFSTSISDAWTVVEKFSQFELWKDKDGEWSCRMVRGKTDHGHSHADTAPMAICRAALKAMEKPKQGDGSWSTRPEE